MDCRRRGGRRRGAVTEESGDNATTNGGEMTTPLIESFDFTRYAEPDERKAVGERIDPGTAGVFFRYADILDPYDDDPDPERETNVGRMWFAFDPVEGVAVWTYDLPSAALAALRRRGIG